MANVHLSQKLSFSLWFAKKLWYCKTIIFLNHNANIEFDKSKVNLVKTDIEDLIDEDDLINYTNKEIEREVEQGNLMYAPDISDYIDPKDD